MGGNIGSSDESSDLNRNEELREESFGVFIDYP